MKMILHTNCSLGTCKMLITPIITIAFFLAVLIILNNCPIGNDRLNAQTINQRGGASAEYQTKKELQDSLQQSKIRKYENITKKKPIGLSLNLLGP
ncbi:MAG: hypothetical protein QME74_09750, partial [Candidatus Edwardsbacteria bacterium]|nr:hypothetical protein [Candidatus Edwardsbacteria bacterium]